MRKPQERAASVGATLEDVARAAGVSPSTASRVLNGSTRAVLPSNIVRVRAAAHSLGYAVDLHAQATARRDSRTMVIVVDSLVDPGAMETAAAVHDRSAQRGHTVRIAVCRLSTDASLDVVRALRGERPREIVVVRPAGVAVHDAVAAELCEYRFHGGALTVIEQEEHP